MIGAGGAGGSSDSSTARLARAANGIHIKFTAAALPINLGDIKQKIFSKQSPWPRESIGLIRFVATSRVSTLFPNIRNVMNLGI